jgi:plasmid stabilization system protein ParE
MSVKHKLVILTPAQRELEEIASVYLELVGPASARNITNRIYDALERLRDFPRIGVMLRDDVLQAIGYRMLICDKHICIYRLLENTIYVYHIVDGRSNYPRLFADLQKASSEHPRPVKE